MAKIEITLGELAKELKGELVGDSSLRVSNIRDSEEAEKGDLAFIFKKKAEPLLKKTHASCSVVPEEIKKSSMPIIRCKNPNLAFKRAVELIMPDYIIHPGGIHPAAILGENVTLGKDVTVGAYACLESGACIGNGTIIYPHCYIGRATEIGASCIIYPNVMIRENIKIGNRVIINSGCVIGADGFGYELTKEGHAKIPQIGNVIIEDDVELGACVMVDRAKIAHTRIGRGTKIDNLVQVAHNVTIGRNCIIVGQCGISGSTKIGNNVMMAGQVGLVDHIEIGDNVMIGAQSGITKSIPANKVVWGTPSRPAKKTMIIYAIINKLPEIYKKLKFIEKKFNLK